MNLDDKTILYLWLLFVGFFGGVLSFLNKQTEAFRWKSFILGVGSSMFSAYIVYELVFYVLQNANLSIAVAGIGAWGGTNLLLKLEARLEKKIEGEK